MSDYSTMKSRIADELKREDLTSLIGDAIKSAIEYYADERFWFNEVTDVTVSAGTSTSGINIASLREITQLLCEVDTGYKYEVLPDTYLNISRINTNDNWQGRPIKYCLSGLRINDVSTSAVDIAKTHRLILYPRPDQVYTMHMSYIADFGTISATASSPWFSAGEELIRTHAKVDILENVMRGPEAFQSAQVLRRREDEALGRVKGKTSRMRSSGSMKTFL